MAGIQFEVDVETGKAVASANKLAGATAKVTANLQRLNATKLRIADINSADKMALGVMRARTDIIKEQIRAQNKLALASRKGGAGGAGMAGGLLKGAALIGVITAIASAAKDAAIALVRMGVQGAIAFTKMVIDASVFRERMAFGFKTLSRGASDGTAELAKMRALSIKFGTDFRDTTESILRLRKLGFGAKEAEELFKSTQDLKTVGATAEELKRVMLAISQIRATGKLQGDELLQLAEAGVDLNAVYKALAKNLGKTVPEVMKLKEAGKIDSATGIQAIKEAIAETTGAKFAGEKGEEFANNTITGMAARIKAMSGAIKDQIAEAIGPAFKQLAPILDDIMKALQSEEAKAVLAEIAAGFTLLFQGAQKAWPVVKALFSSFASEFKGIWAAFKKFGEGLSKAFGGDNKVAMEEIINAARILGMVLAHVVGFMIFLAGVAFAAIAAIAGVWVAISAGITRITNFVTEAKTKALEIGTAIVQGIKDGITGGAGGVIESLRTLATSALAAAKTALGVKSPSKEFAWIGSMVGAGFAGGVDAEGPAANKSMQNMVEPPAPPNVGPSGANVRSAITINVNVPPGTSPNDAEGIAAAIERTLGSSFERLAIEAGF